jgi:hypothetical protein
MVMRTGSRRCAAAIDAMRGGIVAENSTVWRSRGSREDRLEVLGEAHVEHLVGLVEHHDLRSSSTSVPGEVVERPAGVATTTSTPRSSA